MSAANDEIRELVKRLRSDGEDYLRAHKPDESYPSRCGHPACHASRRPCEWELAGRDYLSAADALESQAKRIELLEAVAKAALSAEYFRDRNDWSCEAGEQQECAEEALSDALAALRAAEGEKP